MNTLTQPLNLFIKEQVDLGMVHSEQEVEQSIMADMEKRALERGIKKSQQQFKKGCYVEFDDEFLVSFLSKKRDAYLKKQSS